VLNELKSREDGTTFDETLHALKHDPSVLRNHVVDLLITQINGSLKDEILYYRKVQALFPIISILFKDQTKVEVFVQIRINEKHSQADSNSLSSSTEPIHGVRESTNHDTDIDKTKFRRLYLTSRAEYFFERE
jgi:hypothetical protein